MFDFEIVIASSKINTKYKNRLEEFKKFGLINHNNKKIHISLLLGPGEYDEVDNWPDAFIVEVFQCKSHDAAAKISEYYGSILPNVRFKSRWYLKADDDSITDINSLSQHLENFDINESPLYLCAYLNANLDRQEHELINSNQLSYLINTPNAKIWHEWECSVLNYISIEKIINSKLCLELFLKRALMTRGSSDQTLGIVCRLLNIPPLDVFFLKKDPLILHFSTCFGKISHIHYINHDINAHFYEIFKMSIGETEPERESRSYFSNKKFNFFAIKNGEKVLINKLFLNKNGFIDNGNDNEKIWTDYSGYLQFFRYDSVLTTDFEYVGNGCYQGAYLRNKKIIHRIEPEEVENIRKII